MPRGLETFAHHKSILRLAAVPFRARLTPDATRVTGMREIEPRTSQTPPDAARNSFGSFKRALFLVALQIGKQGHLTSLVAPSRRIVRDSVARPNHAPRRYRDETPPLNMEALALR